MLAALGITTAAAAGTLDQSQPSFGSNFFAIGACGTASLAQTFTAGITGDLDQIDVGVWRDASNESAPLELELYAAPGGIPSGMPLAGATVPASTFVTNPVFAGFTSIPLATPVAVTAGLQYAVVLRPPDLPCMAGYWWLYVEGDPYSGGGALLQFGSDPWQSVGNAGQDFAFQTYVEPDPASNPPTTIGQCLAGGWQSFALFGNEGECVSFVATLPAAGDLDSSFGSGGALLTDLGGLDQLAAVAIQPDGKIVAAGRSLISGGFDFAIARYHRDGSLDLGFGSGGTVVTDLGGIDLATSVAIQRDGMIVVGGRSGVVGSDFALVRYTSDGSLDAGFGSAGTVLTDLGDTNELVAGVAVEESGKIVAAGTSGIGSESHMTVLRYLADGSLDAGFGSGGTVSGPAGGIASAVALQPNGKIVVAGTSIAGGIEFALLRYTSGGSLDAGFGPGGSVVADLGDGSASASAVTLQPDGKIIVAGRSSTGGNTGLDFALARLNGDGSLDSSFGSSGVVLTHFGGADVALGVATDASGNIVAAGRSGIGAAVDFAVARYRPNGRLDDGFGSGGAVVTDLGSLDQATGVAVHPDGNIVAAGSSGIGFTTDFALVRYAAR